MIEWLQAGRNIAFSLGIGNAERGRIKAEISRIVAGQDSKLFTDQYSDETRKWVLLGSRRVGRIVGGYCHWDFRSGYPFPDLGGRSSGVNKA